MHDDSLRVTDNEAAHQYELRVDGHLARLVYVRTGGQVALVHTKVPPAIERRGHGSLLVRTALDDARARGQRVVPSCWFVRAFVERHPEYLDLLSE